MASTARVAGRSTTPAHTRQFGAWRERSGRASLEYSRATLEEIRSTVVRAAFGIGRGGVEIAGLLFGTRLGSFLRILGWLEIPCQHALGPSFRLNERDQEVLKFLIENRNERKELQELQLLGWFVAHSRHELTLMPWDVELANRLFADRDLLTLVLKPGRFGDLDGVLYQRNENGELAAGAPEISIDPCPSALAKSVLPAALGIPQETEVRREPPRPAAKPRRAGRFTGAALAIGILLTSGLAGSSWLVWKSWRSLVLASTPLRLLSLDASVDGGQLSVHWNPASDLLRSETSGVLEIHDARHTTVVELGREQLRSGNYYLEDAAPAGRVVLTLLEHDKVAAQERAQWGPPAAAAQ